jgi:osomolarity two-component system response regulator SKN7
MGGNRGKKESQFIDKLYALLSDSELHIYLVWADDKKSFVVLNPQKFAKRILPLHFSHANFER